MSLADTLLALGRHALAESADDVNSMAGISRFAGRPRNFCVRQIYTSETKWCAASNKTLERPLPGHGWLVRGTKSCSFYPKAATSRMW